MQSIVKKENRYYIRACFNDKYLSAKDDTKGYQDFCLNSNNCHNCSFYTFMRKFNFQSIDLFLNIQDQFDLSSGKILFLANEVKIK